MEEKIRHVAIIMDGNGRWAKKQGKVRTAGHYQGVENVRNLRSRQRSGSGSADGVRLFD